MKRLDTRISVAGLALAAALVLAGPVSAQTNPGPGTAQLGTGGPTCSFSTVTTYPDGGVFVNCNAVPPPTADAIVTLGQPNTFFDAATGGGLDIPVTCTGNCLNLEVTLAVEPAYTGISVVPTILFSTGATTWNARVTGTPPLASGTPVISLRVSAPGSATSTSPTGAAKIFRSITVSSTSDPGTLAIVQNSPGSVIENSAALTVSVSRTGAGPSASGVSVPYTCTAAPTGYVPTITPPSGGVLTWADADATPKTFTITPGALPVGATTGSVTCSLGAGTAVSGNPPTVGTAQYAVTVNKSGGGGGGNCTTSATREVDATPGGTVFFAIAGNGESSAIKFLPTRAPFSSLQLQYTMPAVATGKPAPNSYTFTANIAECPGDFTTVIGPNCGPRTFNRNSGVHNTSTVTPGDSVCMLNPTKTYYYNVRFTTVTGTTTCTLGTAGCATGINLTYQ